MRCIIACAGTGGHINPGIAIANYIKKMEPDSAFLFIGTATGMENEIVKNSGYDIAHIKTGKLYRKLTFKNMKSVVDIIGGIKDAKKIIKEFNPDIVIGTGGYICGPVMYVAKSLKIPYVLHESNAFPGLAVKMFAKNAAAVMTGFEDTKMRLKNKDNVIVTGSPAKFSIESIDKLDKDVCKIELGLDKLAGSRKIVFVTGGSLGAKKFNQVILSMVEKYKSDKFYIVIASGMKNYDELDKLVVEKELSQYIKVERFVFDMEKMYKVSDLLITRAGAMTITELSLSGRPSILVPFPYAAENHQLYNAKVLEEKEAAVVIVEKDLNEDDIYIKIMNLVNDHSKLEVMGKNARKSAILDVEQKIYNEIQKYVTLKKEVN